jgi:hypothetical protein
MRDHDGLDEVITVVECASALLDDPRSFSAQKAGAVSN